MQHTRYKMPNTKSRRRPAIRDLPARGALTLLEMIIVVAVIVILTTMVVGVATSIDNQSRKQLTESTLAILNSALQQFQDFDYRYHSNLNYAAWGDFSLSLKFPLDCNGLATTRSNEPVPPGDLVRILPALDRDVPIITDSENDPNFSGSEILYLCLSLVPQCRETLDKIDKSLLTNKGIDGSPLVISFTADPKDQIPLYRIVDAWGTPLRYDYYNELAPDFTTMKKTIRTFPLITSAGPDKVFGTADDITNR